MNLLTLLQGRQTSLLPSEHTISFRCSASSTRQSIFNSPGRGRWFKQVRFPRESGIRPQYVRVYETGMDADWRYGVLLFKTAVAGTEPLFYQAGAPLVRPPRDDKKSGKEGAKNEWTCAHTNFCTAAQDSPSSSPEQTPNQLSDETGSESEKTAGVPALAPAGNEKLSWQWLSSSGPRLDLPVKWCKSSKQLVFDEIAALSWFAPHPQGAGLSAPLAVLTADPARPLLHRSWGTEKVQSSLSPEAYLITEQDITEQALETSIALTLQALKGRPAGTAAEPEQLGLGNHGAPALCSSAPLAKRAKLEKRHAIQHRASIAAAFFQHGHLPAQFSAYPQPSPLVDTQVQPGLPPPPGGPPPAGPLPVLPCLPMINPYQHLIHQSQGGHPMPPYLGMPMPSNGNPAMQYYGGVMPFATTYPSSHPGMMSVNHDVTAGLQSPYMQQHSYAPPGCWAEKPQKAQLSADLEKMQPPAAQQPEQDQPYIHQELSQQHMQQPQQQHMQHLHSASQLTSLMGHANPQVLPQAYPAGRDAYVMPTSLQQNPATVHPYAPANIPFAYYHVPSDDSDHHERRANSLGADQRTL